MSIATIKSDSQIKSDVLDELKWDPTVDETDVGLQVHNGVVTLVGKVNSYATKLKARDAAHRVAGVLDVVDDMQVRLPKLWERADEDLAGAVRNALRWDVLVPDDRIKTTVSSGTVTLQGTVDTWTQRSEAERAIERLTGVRDVLNQIVVAPRSASPEKIKEEIEGALERQAEREARRLGVAVRDGTVTLTGAVRSWAEKNTIERVAGYALGVRRVDDRTIVDPYC
jgi:osmotically-inducible protein OsmY